MRRGGMRRQDASHALPRTLGLAPPPLRLLDKPSPFSSVSFFGGLYRRRPFLPQVRKNVLRCIISCPAFGLNHSCLTHESKTIRERVMLSSLWIGKHVFFPACRFSFASMRAQQDEDNDDAPARPSIYTCGWDPGRQNGLHLLLLRPTLLRRDATTTVLNIRVPLPPPSPPCQRMNWHGAA
jgi:hypothetical protein